MKWMIFSGKGINRCIHVTQFHDEEDTKQKIKIKYIINHFHRYSIMNMTITIEILFLGNIFIFLYLV